MTYSLQATCDGCRATGFHLHCTSCSPSCSLLQSQAGLSCKRPRRRCCIDTKPRKFDAESANLLCNFAEMVVREIEKEKARVRLYSID